MQAEQWDLHDRARKCEQDLWMEERVNVFSERTVKRKEQNHARGAVLAYDDVWVTAGRLDVARPHASFGQSVTSLLL